MFSNCNVNVKLQFYICTRKAVKQCHLIFNPFYLIFNFLKFLCSQTNSQSQPLHMPKCNELQKSAKTHRSSKGSGFCFSKVPDTLYVTSGVYRTCKTRSYLPFLMLCMEVLRLRCKLFLSCVLSALAWGAVLNRMMHRRGGQVYGFPLAKLKGHTEGEVRHPS